VGHRASFSTDLNVIRRIKTMNPNKLSRADLVDFAANVATAVADGKVTGFLAAQNTSYSDALTDANTELATADALQVSKRASALEATDIADQKRDVILAILSDIKLGVRSVRSESNVYEALGFDPPAETRSVVHPNTPTELAAAGFSNGINQLTFSGNNAAGTVSYVVEAKIGDTAPYAMVGMTRTQKFRHTGVTPGQFYQYRVRAQAARGLVSDWSNEAVVYGS